MEDYNRLISSRILDSYDAMLNTVPQPTMLGGKRMRKYVLPGTTDSDYPGTLSVGRMDGMKPATLAGDFWKDFGDGFPTGSLQPPSEQVGGKFKIGKALKSVGKAIKSSPVGRAVVSTVVPELAGMAAQYGVGALTENPALGKVAASSAKSATKSGLKSQGYGGRNLGRTLKRDAEKLFGRAQQAAKRVTQKKSKGKMSQPAAAQSVSQPASSSAADDEEEYNRLLDFVSGGALIRKAQMKRALAKAKQALAKKVMQKKSKGKMSQSTAAASPAEADDEEEDYDTLIPSTFFNGGALIRNDPSQFHSSVYPPALASYTAGKDAYGRGRAKLPKSGAKRNSARGAIVAEVMKKHGMTLPEASKYVKEKGLY